MKLPVRKVSESGFADFALYDADNCYIGHVTTEDLADELIKRINGYEVLVVALDILAEDCQDCENVGFTIRYTRDGECEQEQCQWCYNVKNSRFNINYTLKKLGEM